MKFLRHVIPVFLLGVSFLGNTGPSANAVAEQPISAAIIIPAPASTYVDVLDFIPTDFPVFRDQWGYTSEAERNEAWFKAEREAAEAERIAKEARDEAWFAAEREAKAKAAASKVAAPVYYSGDVWNIIRDAAYRWGIDVNLFQRIANCESGGNPNAYNSSGASGLFQHLGIYWAGRAIAAGIPGASVWDPWANAEVSARMIALGGTSPWNASRGCWAR